MAWSDGGGEGVKHKPLLLLVMVAAGGAAYFGGRPGNEAARARKVLPPVPVSVAQAVTRDLAVTLELVGRGEAFETVTLKSRLDGQVRDVSFAEGGPVAAGAVLIRLDPGDFQARVNQVLANLARDQALLDKARADVARYQALLLQQFVSQEKVAQLRTDVDAAAAGVHADEAALELARQQLSYCVIRAPFAGLVGARLVHPGASVKINDTELAVINRVRPLYVSFAVAEKYLPAVQAARARGPLEAEIRLPGEDKSAASGKVVFYDNAIDPATATLRMKARIANGDARLAPGQFLSVSLRLGTLHDAVVVPAEAVQQGPEGSFVYVLGREGGAQMRPVELTQVRAGQAGIAHGLIRGETVITDGYSRLTPGAKVRVKRPEGHG